MVWSRTQCITRINKVACSPWAHRSLSTGAHGIEKPCVIETLSGFFAQRPRKPIFHRKNPPHLEVYKLVENHSDLKYSYGHFCLHIVFLHVLVTTLVPWPRAANPVLVRLAVCLDDYFLSQSVTAHARTSTSSEKCLLIITVAFRMSSTAKIISGSRASTPPCDITCCFQLRLCCIQVVLNSRLVHRF